MSNRREFLHTFLAGSAGALVLGEFLSTRTLSAAQLSSLLNSQADGPWEIFAPRILARIKAPTFPARDFSVIGFGAKADGKTDCTDAFRKAIEACGKAGGGRVVVPAGEFLTGAIHLKSNVNLHVTKRATIKFSQDPRKYLPVVFTRWEGMELMNYSPFIYAFEQTNIAITGEGIIDGQADCDHWWPWKGRPQCGWKKGDPEQSKARALLYEHVAKGAPVNERVFGDGSFLRPQFIQPYRCQNVLIEGVTLRHSPMWQIHPVLCTNVIVRGVNIEREANATGQTGPNTDGCDPESCRDVLIENCVFATGDDCIAIKAGRNNDGRRVAVPSENIVIRGCRMKDGHGGITVGSEISGGVRNVFAENCRLDSANLNIALRFKNNALRGGRLENFYFRKIEVGQVSDAVLTIDFNYEEGEKGPFTPVVRNVVVSNLLSGKSPHALDLQGFKQAPIYNVRLEDCTFDNVASGSIVKNVQGLELRNVRVNGKLVTEIGRKNVGDSRPEPVVTAAAN
jgi:polygalacturonase